MGRDIHKAVGVWIKDDKTCYFQNPSGIWELPSQQHEPYFLDDPEKPRRINLVMQQLSNERFYGAPIRVGEHICDNHDEQGLPQAKIHLKLYYVEFGKPPILNRAFYTHMEWMTPEEFIAANEGKQTGIETKSWLQETTRKKQTH